MGWEWERRQELLMHADGWGEADVRKLHAVESKGFQKDAGAD